MTTAVFAPPDHYKCHHMERLSCELMERCPHKPSAKLLAEMRNGEMIEITIKRIARPDRNSK